MAKQLVLANPPQDIMEAIFNQVIEKTKRTKRTVSMTEAAFDLIRKGATVEKP